MNIAIRQKIIQATKNGPTDSAPIVGLHCSGATSRQWSALRSEFESRAPVLLPEFIGTESRGHRTGSGRFSLREEAVEIVREIRALPGPAHLVAHSYGGGVALHIARRRPDLLASLTLIEPTAFHLLKDGAGEDRAAYREIVSVAEPICRSVISGRARDGMARFVDYWNGAGTWDGMSRDRQDTLVARAAKVPLDFRALLHEEATAANFRSVTVPTLLVRGTQSPRPAVRVTEMLSRTLPRRTTVRVAAAGHMVPLTHGKDVNPVIRDFVAGHDRPARIAA